MQPLRTNLDAGARLMSTGYFSVLPPNQAFTPAQIRAIHEDLMRRRLAQQIGRRA